MKFSFSKLDYRQKGIVAELIYLLFIGVVSPFAVGLQIFDSLSFTLSLVLLNILQLPAIMVFYRFYLPNTIGRGRYLIAALLVTPYLMLYEFSSRLASIIIIELPFIPLQYRSKLMDVHPEDFTQGYFNQSLGYTSLVLLAATTLYVLKLLFKNQHHLTSIATEKLRLELDQLKSQIQPHFFFNTLNNMYALSMQQSPETPRMIKNLSSIMRYVLYESSQEKVSLKSEADFIRSYIQLESFRHSPSEIIEFSTQGNLSGAQVEPLLFMPLIENTFKHLLNQQTSEKWIRIVLSLDEDELIFQTTNPIAAQHSTGGKYSG
ncbi:MAG: histidine kinase, partial [Pedobacter sp.]